MIKEAENFRIFFEDGSKRYLREVFDNLNPEYKREIRKEREKREKSEKKKDN